MQNRLERKDCLTKTTIKNGQICMSFGNIKIKKQIIDHEMVNRKTWDDFDKEFGIKNNTPQYESPKQKKRNRYSWLYMYDLLQEYMAANGNRLPPSNYVAKNGKKLGGWIYIQHISYYDGLLDESMVKKLESIPGWVWNMENVK
ncbi:MAG: helicase associated domain-containing protein [Paraclostridium sp.]